MANHAGQRWLGSAPHSAVGPPLDACNSVPDLGIIAGAADMFSSIPIINLPNGLNSKAGNFIIDGQAGF